VRSTNNNIVSYIIGNHSECKSECIEILELHDYPYKKIYFSKLLPKIKSNSAGVILLINKKYQKSIEQMKKIRAITDVPFIFIVTYGKQIQLNYEKQQYLFSLFNPDDFVGELAGKIGAYLLKIHALEGELEPI
jgi:hypothetical protein